VQFSSTKKPPPGVVFDSDMGNRIDSALALGLLHGLEGKNFTKISSISVSKSNLKSAQFADLIEKYYAGPPVVSVAALASFQAQAIGMAVDGKLPEDTPIITGILAAKNEGGAKAYAPRIETVNDTAIVEALIRNALTANYDKNALVVIDGPATNAVRLLDLQGAKEIVAAKVKVLVMVGGTFGGSNSGAPDPSFSADIKAARRLLAEWPTPIVLVGREIGAALPYPGSSIEKDFTKNVANPIPVAYRLAKAMPYDAPAPALAACLYAVRPAEGFFQMSGPGTVKIADDGRASFTAEPSGRHRYLIADPTAAERVTKTYTELISAAPVRRMRRPLLADAAEEKKADEKKSDPTTEKKP
jgi:hypothetical protein